MKRVSKINNMLEIPKEVYTNQPKLVITGFDEMIIENYKGILEYDEYYIKINTHIGSVNIHGINLKLEKMTEDNLRITGKIENLEIERITD